MGKPVREIIFILLVSLVPLKQAEAERGEPAPSFRPRTKASQCKPLDARTARPELKAFYAARKTQDHLGWCYASAAADLLSQRLGRPVSGVDLAVSYNHELYENPLKHGLRRLGNALKITKTERGAYEGGSIAGAVRQAARFGACPAERIPSHINLEAERTGFELVSLIATLRDLGKTIRAQRAGYDDFLGFSVNSVLSYGSGANQVDCPIRAKGIPLIEEFFPGVDTRALYRLLVAKAGQDVNETLFQLAQQHCEKERLNLKGIKAEALSAADRARWPQIMDSRLKKGDLVGLELRSKMLFPHNDGWLDLHAVSVVARKFENGQCKYLIRDSLATECKHFAPELQRDCDPKTLNVWVPEARINRYMLGITYLK